MAQTVASTAAKASYLHTMPTTAQAQPTYTAAKKDPKLANNWKTKSAAELTDAEVMAMPDSEYMNDKQMAFFRLKLVQLKQDIHNSAGETTEHLREDTVVVPDPADRATIEEEHALELRTRDRERKLLKKIEQAIARIDAGDYGYCDETGEAIGVGRLKDTGVNFAAVVRATVRGNVIIAITQGAIGGVSFWALGIEAALLWGVVMTFLSMLPAIRAATTLPVIFDSGIEGGLDILRAIQAAQAAGQPTEELRKRFRAAVEKIRAPSAP